MANKTTPRLARLAIVALLPLLLSGCWWGPYHGRGYGPGPGYHGYYR